jgi:hypothetical protein
VIREQEKNGGAWDAPPAMAFIFRKNENLVDQTYSIDRYAIDPLRPLGKNPPAVGGLVVLA